MKKFLFNFIFAYIIILLAIPAQAAWLAGYQYKKTIPITGSDTGAVSNYPVTINVSPYSNPIESGTWTVNSKTYNYRIAMTVLEQYNDTYTSDAIAVIDTEWLVDNGYFTASSPNGYEIEITQSDGSTCMHYAIPFSGYSFDDTHTRYKFRVNLTAKEIETYYKTKILPVNFGDF